MFSFEFYIFISVLTFVVALLCTYLDRTDLTIGSLMLHVLAAIIPFINCFFLLGAIAYVLEHIGPKIIFKWSKRK